MAVDLPPSIVLPLGETQQWRLPGRGGAGYGWVVTVDGLARAVDATITGADSPTGPPGKSMDELLVVRGLAAGTVRVHVALLRPWQPDQVLDEATMTVKVGP